MRIPKIFLEGMGDRKTFHRINKQKPQIMTQEKYDGSTMSETKCQFCIDS